MSSLRGAHAGHQALVAAQFGSRAGRYVTSAVHAQGADLQSLAALAAAAGPVRVLDLGCGGGHVSFTVAPHVAEVVAYDLSPEMLAAVDAAGAERGLTNVRTCAGSAETLPFADATFDLVVTRFSVHHWSDVATGLAEAQRVLRTGGRAVFIDVSAPERPVLDSFLQAIEILRDPSHVRDYTPSEWSTLLSVAGFRIESATMRRLPLEFASWIERMNTPRVRADAIVSLREAMPAEVRAYFEIGAGGDFVVDTIDLLTSKAPR